MARPLLDSPYIFGIHEPGGELLMLEAGRPGWVMFSEVVGHDPDDRTGIDFTTFSNRGLGVICRLNHAHEPDGTIPHSSLYEQYARRVANFVATSRGCKIWVLGNEMNYAVERPGIQIDWSRHASVHGDTPEDSDPLRRGLAVRFNVLPDHSTEIRTTRGAMVSPGETITPELYARCFRLCRDAIRRMPGHQDDQLLVGAVAPWNTQTIYSGNANGDWVQYFVDILTLLGPKGCDGFALHAYTHGADPALISSLQKLTPPFQNYHSEFRTYIDFMASVPENMRHLAAFITEADQTTPWADAPNGWVQQAYAEIDAWNRQPGNQLIRALILYRWPRMDRWYIDGKTGVVDDFRQALQNDFRWQGTESKGAAAQESPAIEVHTMPAGPFYRVQWLEDRVPAKLTAGQVVMIPITARNTGATTWLWGGANPFRVGYRYYRNRRLLSLGSDKELRTDVPKNVEPEGEVSINVRVALPDQPGNYTLELDFLHDGVTWFKEQGSPVLTRWLTVEAPPAAEMEGSNGVVVNLPVPLFSDVTLSLPRAGTPYARRLLNQVRYLVISHTGANPWLSLDRIAETHIRHGNPGIVYNFVVDSSGQVFKVCNLEDVAQPNQRWSEQGVNICLAGNFSITSPALAQLDAAGRLCAWLAQNLGLTAESIVGMGELARSDSPGDTFYGGVAWKSILARMVRLHLAALGGAGDTARSVELSTVIDELKTRNRTLEAQFAELTIERTRLDATNQQLQEEIKAAEERLAVQHEEGAGIRIHRWMDRLPREASRYRERKTQDIRYLVIHHTGVAPDVPLEQIARAHLADWPGILYDYYVDAKGEVFQTQPLDAVVETDQEYLANAVNIAFAGDFTDQIPTNEQLTAGSKLIAWLMDRAPQLRTEHIKGVSELIGHSSPGEQWLSGQMWKDMLLAGVRRTRGMVEPTEIEYQLRVRVGDFEQRLLISQRANQSLQDQVIRLQADVQKLQARLQEQQENRVYIVPKPAIRVVVDQLPKHPTYRYERRNLSQITHLAIHHTATPPSMTAARIADLHVSPDASRGKDAWPGIGYHYFVNADGSIDQTNHLDVASYHVHKHNLYSIGVAFAGSFMNGKIPTSAQMRAGGHIVAWLMQELNIPLARVWGHREFPDNTTVCPGSEWTMGNRWRDLLFERIEQIQSGMGVKSIRHYMLFWQRPFPGPMARQDYGNAINYVVRFRPTLGFSVQDARNAEYVTVVGNEAGIGAEEEETLRSSGCKVERIAGRDEEETSRVLAELANLGRRFRTFDVDF